MKTHTNIQTTVQINKDWSREFAQADFVMNMLVAIHVSIDPITCEKSCVIFTDDGRGNGTPVISFGM